MAQIDTLCYRKNTHKYDSCIAFKMHLQLLSSAHVEHVSYCQSRSIWVGTLKAERKEPCDSSVTTSSHCDTQRHTHTLLVFPPLGPHATAASNVVTVGVKSAGPPNKDTSSKLYVNGPNQMVIQFGGMRGLRVSCFVALSFDELSKKIIREGKFLFMSQVEAKKKKKNEG